jgi:transcriptional regulator with XRE-family HTH domain
MRYNINYHLETCIYNVQNIMSNTLYMVTTAQLRAARVLLGLDQRALAQLAGLSHPTVQRMEASSGVIRGNVDSLAKIISALETAGVELIGEGISSTAGGCGVRLRTADSSKLAER